MGAALLIAAAWLAHASGPCDEDGALTVDRWDLLDSAQQAVIEVDFQAGREALAGLEETFACGPATDPRMLGQMWLLEGALSALEGDTHNANLAWEAASRVAPGRWIEDLGGPLRADYEAALERRAGASTVRVEPALPEGWTFFLDGRPASSPAQVPAGLHLVQIGPSAERVQIGRIILTDPITPSAILIDPEALGLEPQAPVAAASPSRPPEPPPAAPAAPPPARPVGLRPWLAVAPIGALGRPLQSEEHGAEPSLKFVLAAEVGAVFQGSTVWARGAASAGPLLGGRFLYATDDQVHGSVVALGGHVAAGARVGIAEPGLLVGVAWPGRLQLHGVVGLHPEGSPLRLELRVGAHLATERSPEPAAGLAISLPL